MANGLDRILDLSHIAKKALCYNSLSSVEICVFLNFHKRLLNMSSLDGKKRYLEVSLSSIRDLDYESKSCRYEADVHEDNYARRADQLLRTLAPQYQNERTKFKIYRSLETVCQWLKKNKKYLSPSSGFTYRDPTGKRNSSESGSTDKSRKKLTGEGSQSSPKDKHDKVETSDDVKNCDSLNEQSLNNPRILTGEKYKRQRRQFFNRSVNEQQMNVPKLYSLEEWIEFRYAIRSAYSSKVQPKDLGKLENYTLGQVEYSSEDIVAILDSEPEYKKTVNEILAHYLEEQSEARVRLGLLKTLNSVSMMATREPADHHMHGNHPSANFRDHLHCVKDNIR